MKPQGAPTNTPVGLRAQFRKNLWLYVVGTVMLAAQQWLMAERDFYVRDAVDAITQAKGSAARIALFILLVSVAAMITRLVSRITVFAAGRNVEYEVRAALLRHLHGLGPSFFSKVPTGEIMSRATNDLQQIRLLLGFGVLNVAGSVFALLSALWVMIAISGRLRSEESRVGEDART